MERLYFSELCFSQDDPTTQPLSDDEMAKLMKDMALTQDKIDASNRWELDRIKERAMDALRCPPIYTIKKSEESDLVSLPVSLFHTARYKMRMYRYTIVGQCTSSIIIRSEPKNHYRQ